MTQGLSKYDAIAALLLEKGELQDAMLRAFAYAGKKQGTVVNIWVNKCPNVPEVGCRVALRAADRAGVLISSIVPLQMVEVLC